MAIAVVTAIGANAQYKIGDICTLDGVKGIVVDVDATGAHGLIMSLEESKADWIAHKSLAMETNAFYEDDDDFDFEEDLDDEVEEVEIVKKDDGFV